MSAPGPIPARVRRGVFVPNFGRGMSEPQALAELARRAEHSGFDGFFLWDHVARPGGPALADPWVSLAAVALATERVRLGPLVTPLPRRRPWQVARAAASLDRLSGGRLVLGVGIGSGRGCEWDDLGEQTDPRVRGEMLDEALGLLRALFAGEPLDHRGPHYGVRAEAFTPPPVQRPLPIWVAASGVHAKPLQRASRAQGVFPLVRTPDALRACLALVDAAGPRPPDVVVTLETDAARSPSDLGAWVEAGATWILDTLIPEEAGEGTRGLPAREIEAWLDAGPSGPHRAGAG